MAEFNQADYAEFQAFQEGKAARQAAADAQRITYAQVLHKLIAGASWGHEAERNAAHDAVDREFPSKDAAAERPNETVTNKSTDQGITQPVPYVAA